MYPRLSWGVHAAVRDPDQSRARVVRKRGQIFPTVREPDTAEKSWTPQDPEDLDWHHTEWLVAEAFNGPLRRICRTVIDPLRMAPVRLPDAGTVPGRCPALAGLALSAEAGPGQSPASGRCLWRTRARRTACHLSWRWCFVMASTAGRSRARCGRGWFRPSPAVPRALGRDHRPLPEDSAPRLWDSDIRDVSRAGQSRLKFDRCLELDS